MYVCKCGAARCVMSHSRIGEADKKQREDPSLFSVVNQTAASCENGSTIEAFCGCKRRLEYYNYKYRCVVCQIYQEIILFLNHRVRYMLAPQYTDKMMGNTIKIDHKDWPLNAIIFNRT